jgi:hypothetical protein
VSESDALEAALNRIYAATGVGALIAAIDSALAVNAPAGAPDTVAAQADTNRRIAQICQEIADDETNVRATSLPASWRGGAADNAATALSALTSQASAAHKAFAAGSKALTTWADQLRTAQSQDTHGREQLENARTQLLQPHTPIFDPFYFSVLREPAASGCHDRWAAASLAASGAADASAALSQLSEQALARLIRVPGVNALTAVTLAYYDDFIDALTPTAEMLASKHLDAMSSADRSTFEQLMADASSPTEAQFLFKAASAGYSLDQLESFDAVIRPHGNDLGWLYQHLDPNIVTSTPARGTFPVSPAFDQGPHGDCVSASTVMARLAADPVLTLGVTTGKGPAAVGGAKAGDDSQAAVAARTQHLFDQYNAYYQQHIGRPNITEQASALPGWPRATITLDNRLLTPVTGSTYQFQPLNDAADRQAAVPKIEAAVEAGKPVPIDVASSSEGHQVIIEGYQNGQFETYQPWGFTQWDPTQQFVDGKLGALTAPSVGGPPGGLPDPYAMQLPQQ